MTPIVVEKGLVFVYWEEQNTWPKFYVAVRHYKIRMKRHRGSTRENEAVQTLYV